jgi:putative MATE family efflux protein
MLRFAMPIMATSVLQAMYHAADMVVVGNFAPNGSFAMGAVGASGDINNLLIGSFISLAVGVGICVAQSIGAKRYEDVKKYVHTSVIMAIFFGVLLAIIGITFADVILGWINTPESLMEEAAAYMRAYFLGVPAMVIYNFLASALRSAGDSKRPLYFLGASGLINVIVNFIMVLGFKMGAVGVGIATAVAQNAALVMIVVYMARTDGPCKIRLSDMKMSWDKALNIIKNGLPTCLSSLVNSFTNTVAQANINSFGDIVVTGSAAANNVYNFVYLAMNAFCIAAMTMVGQNYGAGNYKRIKKSIVASASMVAVSGILVASVIVIFHDQLLSIYAPGYDIKTVAVREAGFIKLLYIGCPYFIAGDGECFAMVLKGMGRPVIPMVVALVGSSALRLLWIYTLCQICSDNVIVLYLSYPTLWILTTAIYAAITVVIYLKESKKQRLKLLQEGI